MLLLMRQWAVAQGLSQYLRCPPELHAPGGDAYSVRTIETEVPDGSVRREIEVTRDPSAYQVAEAKNRLDLLRGDLAALLKSDRSLREQAETPRADVVQRETALTRMAEVATQAKALGDRIREFESEVTTFEPESWRFPLDLAGVRLVAS
jgi:hypothetical protein